MICGRSPEKLGTRTPVGRSHHVTSGGIAAIPTMNAIGKAEPYRTGERHSRPTTH
jgi:hypothetical protein